MTSFRVWLLAAILTALAGLWGCALPRPSSTLKAEMSTFNMTGGFDLAVKQDSLLVRYARGEVIPPDELVALRANPWIRASQEVAPGNLVIRQWGLIDLLSHEPSNAPRILELAELLAPSSPDNGGRVWSEGYSYWRYTRDVLAPWVRAFPEVEAARRVGTLISSVDSCFAATTYVRNGSLYPAPFGDLRDEPLVDSLLPAPASSWREGWKGRRTCGFVTAERTDSGSTYRIAAQPVGLNTHIPADTQWIAVREGFPQGFRFYEGYSRKYPRSVDEKLDMLRIERVESVNRLHLAERFGNPDPRR